MIVATYKQWVNGSKYIDGYYEEYTSVYEDKSKLLENQEISEQKDLYKCECREDDL